MLRLDRVGGVRGLKLSLELQMYTTYTDTALVVLGLCGLEIVTGYC